ncbi:hypothetical protein NGA_0731300, partial [Nannochloropsis gaditana CCMP526]
MHHFHHLVEDSLSYNFASHYQQDTSSIDALTSQPFPSVS